MTRRVEVGVLSCSRKGCPNVMCDRCSSVHGYICDDCFDELVKTGGRVDIDEFMETTPSSREDMEDLYKYYNGIFSTR